MFGNKDDTTKDILVTTTARIEDREVIEYLGVVTGSEAYKAADGIHNQDYNFNEAYQTALSRAKKRAINDFGADAIIGLSFNMAYTGVLQEMLITVQGTCVKLGF